MAPTEPPLDNAGVAERLAQLARLVFELHASSRALNAGDTFSTFIDLPDVLQDQEQVAFDVGDILSRVAQESGFAVGHTTGGNTLSLTRVNMPASQPVPARAAAAAAELAASAFTDLEEVMHRAELVRIAASAPATRLPPPVTAGLMLVLRQVVKIAVQHFLGHDDAPPDGP
jgi:hypothetical protein